MPSSIRSRFACPRICLVVGSIGVCISSLLTAQSSHQIFQHLTTEEGLSSNKVTAVIQDREGFYWIATQNGLNRFDGTSFTPYFHQPGDSTSLAHNNCTDLLEDEKGDIWITTYEGLCVYRKQSRLFTTIDLSAAGFTPGRSLRLTQIASDGDSTAWISGSGLWKINTATRVVNYYPPDTADIRLPSPYEYINYIVYDSLRKGLWISLQGQLNFHDTKSGQFFSDRNNPLGWRVFGTAMPGAIALDATGQLWYVDVSTQALASFDPATNSLHPKVYPLRRSVMNLQADPQNQLWLFYWSDQAEILNPSSGAAQKSFFLPYHSYSMLTPMANGFYLDPEGHYWITSSQGISIYHPKEQYYKIYPFDLYAFAVKSAVITVQCVAQLKPGVIWMGTEVGLMEFELQKGKLRKINLPSSAYQTHAFSLPYENQRVTALGKDDGQLFVGVRNKVYRYDPESDHILQQFTVEGVVQFIQREGEKYLWVGMWSNGLYRIDLHTGEKLHFTKGEDPGSQLRTNGLLSSSLIDRELWIGYNGGHGFTSVDLRTGALTPYRPVIDSVSSYAHGTINAIAHTGGKIWLGTYGGGLISFDPSTGSYLNVQQGEGLKSNYINNIIPDHLGRMWISSADGLSVFDLSRKSLVPLPIDMGFPTNDYVDSGCKGVNGKIYFFKYDKIIEIDPAMYQPDLSFPRIVVSRFSVFEKDTPIPPEEKAIALTHRQNFFSFDFSAVKSHPDEHVQYAYQLHGFDPDWVEAAVSPAAGYTNVPPGTYRFMVRVKNEAGQWSDALWSRELVISPPFWKTAWFIALCIAGVGSILYAFHRYRIRQLEKIYSIRTQISRDLHDDIGASLSSIHIYSAVAENEMEQHPEKAKAFLQQINTNSRQVMEDISDIVWANRLQHQEHLSISARIKNYGYDLLAQQNISCRYQIDPAIETRLTRPEARRNVLLIIKEALNNVAKYSAATAAEVELGLDDRALVVCVKDNGTGFNPDTPKGGNGLDHMRRRTEALSGVFSLRSTPGSGTEVTCHIPIANISDHS